MKISSSYTSPRIQAIDFIRGIALLGILLINIQTYTLFAFLKPRQVYQLHLDKPETYAPAQFFIHLFVKGQFYSIFSFLFGLSFYLMYSGLLRRGLDAGRLFRRRLWTLLFIGLFHAFVFWFGDVLHKYALLGFSLPFFYQKSIRTIFKWIAGIVVLAIVLQLVNTLYFNHLSGRQGEGQHAISSVIMHVIHVWKTGSLIEVASLQWLCVIMLYARILQNGLANFAHYEIMFLLGIVAGKMNAIHRLHEYRLQLIRLGLLLFPLAILLKAISCIPDLGLSAGLGRFAIYEPVICSLAQFIAVPILSLIYLTEVSLMLRNKSSWFITAVANAGRMSLTNYLMQTAICMLLFYGYAGGLAGKLTLLEALAVAVVIYIFQVIFSFFWLKYYTVGPVEATLKSWVLPSDKNRTTQKEEAIIYH